MGLSRKLKSLLFEPEPSFKVRWAPEPAHAPTGRWRCALRDSSQKIRWRYCTWEFVSRAGEWDPYKEAAHAEMRAFLDRLAERSGYRPADLWAGSGGGDMPSHGLLACCDFRLLDYSAAFLEPRVLDEMLGLAAEVRGRIAAGPETVGTRYRKPVTDYPFEYRTVAGVTFGVCWYRDATWLDWPTGDSFRLVPSADQKESQARRQWEAVLGEVSTRVVDQVTGLPLLDEAVLPARPPGSRGRPGVPRRLDGSSHLQRLDGYAEAVLNPIHDVLLRGIQLQLDQLDGQACPYQADNERLVAKVNDLARRYGFQLYFVYRGEGEPRLVRLSIGVKASSSASEKNAAAPSVLAGVFLLSFYDEAGGKPFAATNTATFPRVIVARDHDQAVRFWKATPTDR